MLLADDDYADLEEDKQSSSGQVANPLDAFLPVKKSDQSTPRNLVKYTFKAENQNTEEQLMELERSDSYKPQYKIEDSYNNPNEELIGYLPKDNTPETQE